MVFGFRLSRFWINARGKVWSRDSVVASPQKVELRAQRFSRWAVVEIAQGKNGHLGAPLRVTPVGC